MVFKIYVEENECKVFVNDNESFVNKVNCLDDLLALEKKLSEYGLTGGLIFSDDEIVVSDKSGLYELSDWLTERLNIPFTYSTLDEYEQNVEAMKWNINYHGFEPGKNEYSSESLLTVGNGFIGLRGTTPEMEISAETYPATYLASLYNTAVSNINGRDISNEDFVNAPNMQKMYLLIDNEKVDFTHCTIHYFKRNLNLKHGLFQAWYELETNHGKRIKFEFKKFVSMYEKNQYNLNYSFTPVNFSGEVKLVIGSDGDVYNYNVERYRSLTNRHLDEIDYLVDEKRVILTAKTNQSKITIRQSSSIDSNSIDLSNLIIEKNKKDVKQIVLFHVEQGANYQIERVINVEKFNQDEEIPTKSLKDVTFKNFEASLRHSAKEWDKLWHQAAIKVEGDFMSQKLLNLHTYHLLVSASPNGNKGSDASVTARGLHGEAYRGHIFWDELFILPFYIIHFPETARELLMYRYRRLEAAKIDAKKDGHKGAMFPWQSGLNGSEQSQELHLNPISGEWKEDHSRLQRHVSLAIAYNVWLYWNSTKDMTFMNQYGLELLLEIAHFWESLAKWDESEQRYFIEGVMGPDEFHESYPWSEKGGLKNNAYTNMMVVWLFEEIAKLRQEMNQQIFSEVQTKVQMDQATFDRMAKIQHLLGLEINSSGIIAQYQDYFKLKEIDWKHYKNKYDNIYRMDRILNAEGKNADDYQVAKQADSLMIFYNLSKKQVDKILKDMNYSLPEDYIEKNLDYYLKRTSHGSTLSRIVHAQLAAMINEKEMAWNLYKEALYSDYRDIQGGTTAEGIHAGVMAATLFIPLTTFAGLDIRKDLLSFAPDLPNHWKSIEFSIIIRSVTYKIRVTHEKIVIVADTKTTIEVNNQQVELEQGKEKSIVY
ncbi:glycoside hydrolase family 65 protein [Vagococcus elongatus]|uniref:Family 65 glycosyl hydrolase n=1 Tax=Vagococcus elongatus TaxID=180344 RepID=A0A430B4B3_9ENTE|nr:glycosyl hydrolase family 65 protein [Vagococcus elongatus]RSU15148.1 family 65 glycosyl hydrolase [Vagococcus elongatus]